MTTKEWEEYKRIGFMSDIQTKVDEIRELRKELKQSEFDTLFNNSEEFKNIVFIKKQGVKKNEYL